MRLRGPIVAIRKSFYCASSLSLAALAEGASLGSARFLRAEGEELCGPCSVIILAYFWRSHKNRFFLYA